MIKKNMLYYVLYCSLLIFVMSGCNKIDYNMSNNEWKIENNKIFTYNPFIQNFITYDIKKKQNDLVIKGTKSNIIQYSFSTPSKIFTSGDSIKNNFTIIENKDGRIKKIFKMEDNDLAIFPLATDEKNYFFIQTNYSDKNKINSCIVKYQDNNIHKYTKTNGLISYGALLDNVLYYTIYEPLKNQYTLYKLETSDYNNNPEIIKTGLVSGEILLLNNILYYSNQKMFYNEIDSFEKKSINLSDNKNNTLIQIDPSNNNNYLELVVIDKVNNKIIYKGNNVLAIDLYDNILKVYGTTSIEKVLLDKKDN